MKIYVTNLSDYNNGILRGKWVNPAGLDGDDWAKYLHSIGVSSIDEFGDSAEDGGKITSEEFFITDVNDAPSDCIGEYTPLDECTRWAALCDEYGLDLVSAIISLSGAGIDRAEDILSSSDYRVFYDVHDHESMGISLFEDYYFDCISKQNPLFDYIDYDALGRDYHLNSNGDFYKIDGVESYIEIL